MKKFFLFFLLFTQVAEGAGLLVPPWKKANSTDLIPRSTTINTVYGNTQGFSLGLGEVFAPTSQLDVVINSDASVGEIIKEHSTTQTGNALEVQDSSGNILTNLDSNGYLGIGQTARTVSSGNVNFFKTGGGAITNNGTGIVTSFAATNAINQNGSTGFAFPHLFIEYQAAVSAVTSATTMTEPMGVYYNPTSTANGVVWTGVDIFGAFVDAPNFAVSNGGSFSGMTHNGFTSNLTVSSGTVDSRRSVRIKDATGSGTLTNQYGVVIENLTKGATLNIPLYIQGTGSSGNRIIPKTMIGSDASPTSQLQMGAGTFEQHVNSLTFSATISVDATLGNIFNLASAATGNATLNFAAAPRAGTYYFILLCDAVSTHTFTFGTSFKPSGTRACGGTSKTLAYSCVSDGTNCWELTNVNGL